MKGTARAMTETGHQQKGIEPNRLPGAVLVSIALVDRDPDQPRRDWRSDWQLDAKDASYKKTEEGYKRLDELTASIKEFGILQPLIVRRNPEKLDHFIVIAGGRRLIAARRAGMATIPVIIRDEELARVRVLQLVENLQRQQLHPLDEARAYQELMELEGLTTGGVAARVHVSIQTVRDRLRLLRDQILSDAVERRQIAASVAREINKLPDETAEELRQRVQSGEKLQLADVEAIRRQLRASGVINPRWNPRLSDTSAEELGEIIARPVPETKSGDQVDRAAREILQTRLATPLEYDASLRAPTPSVPVRREHETGQGGEMPREGIGYANNVALRSTPPMAPGQRMEKDDRLDTSTVLNRAITHSAPGPLLGDLVAQVPWAQLEELLDYGIAHGWTCAGLKQAALQARAR